jgi:hypothetical protein
MKTRCLLLTCCIFAARLLSGQADAPTLTERVERARLQIAEEKKQKATLAAASPAKKKTKAPKPPSQDAVVLECIRVDDIRSRALSLFSGVGAYEPGLTGTINNNCDRTVSVFLTVAYFDSKGQQFGDGIINHTVASGATYPFVYQALFPNQMDRGRLKLARIVGIQAFPR